MMRHVALLTLMSVFGVAKSIGPFEPQQIHIAAGASPDEITIVWNTANDTIDTLVLYGNSAHLNLTTGVNGTRSKFVDGGSEKRVQYVHTVILTKLQPSTVYYYKVGSKNHGFSDVLSFRTWPEGENWSPRLAMFGDFGNTNDQSMARLTHDTVRGMYDAILHIGDFAYDMDSDNARVGDDFMRKIQPMASSVPYMTCVGNHEYNYNFTNYKNRFHMPGDLNQRMYYSFKMGPIRFISTNTESIFFPGYGLVPIVEHYEWLERELKDANLPENRKNQPWVITLGHRPMYCSNDNNDDCTHHESLIRTGIPFLHFLGWEKLFYDYGVDIALWAHQHAYERLWPVYNRKVMNGSYEKPYTNPKAPIHIVSGSAGCREKHNPFDKVVDDWSAFRSTDYGYTRMKVYNSTHLYMEQVSDDKGGAIIDKILVVKDTHGPYQHDPTPVKPVGDQTGMIEKWLKVAQAAINKK